MDTEFIPLQCGLVVSIPKEMWYKAIGKKYTPPVETIGRIVTMESTTSHRIKGVKRDK